MLEITIQVLGAALIWMCSPKHTRKGPSFHCGLLHLAQLASIVGTAHDQGCKAGGETGRGDNKKLSMTVM